MANLTGWILEKYNHMEGAYTCHRLQEEGKALGMDVRILGVHDTQILPGSAGVTVRNGGEELTSADFILLRYKWGRMRETIPQLAKRCYNSVKAFGRYVNKYEQLRNIHSKEALLPHSLLVTAQYPYESAAEEFGTVFVAKGLESSMGQEIFLVRTQEAWEALRKEYGPEREWLLQEYIAESSGRDMRIYSIRGKAVAGMVRESEGDFRANVALGARVSPLEITQQMEKICKDVYISTGLDFVGIDLLFGEEKPYFCEVNVMPGLEGIEQATGVNVAGMVMGTIASDFAEK